MTKNVNHINIMNDENEVYCRLRKKVVELDEIQQRDYCGSCHMFRGSAQGRGVECEWEDVRDIPDPYMITRPHVEKDHIVTTEAKANR
jgi:hypothetical protein